MSIKTVAAVLSLVVAMAGCTCESDEAEQNKALVMKAMEIMNSHDYTELDTVIAEEYKRHCQATPDVVVESLDDFKALLQRWDQEIPDGSAQTNMIIAEGDLVAVWGTYSGTQEGPMGVFPATGKRLESEMGAFFRVEDGKIAETWVTWDNLAILNQLGLFPPAEAAQADMDAD